MELTDKTKIMYYDKDTEQLALLEKARMRNNNGRS